MSGEPGSLMNKQLDNLAQAVAGIADGASAMIGGFGGSGAPIELIHALIDQGARELTVINNNAGNGHVGIAALIEQGRVAKMICSFPRSADPRVFTELYKAGSIQLELVPQGTLAERIRAGGAGYRRSTRRRATAPTWPKASRWPNSMAGCTCRNAG